jgi:NAD(P)-dependent dehydrogenase (short-subunit alcohol dehydrogenase family)/acyl carrier protein
MGRADLTDRLVQIVSDRTGYPREMLDLDSNIEADLGIDSIKRVEILGAFQRSLPAERQLPPGAMEKLTAIKTMRGIIDWVQNALQIESVGPTDKPSSPPAAATVLPSTPQVDNRNGVPRFLMTSVDAPLYNPRKPSAMEGVFLVTDDESGFSQSVGHQLKSHGARAVILRMGTAPGRLEEGIYATDLTRPEAVHEVVQSIRRQYGPIKGLIHLLPLKGRKRFEEMELGDWRAGLSQDVKALFHLAKSAGPDLNETRGWMVAATASSSSPGQGGIAGLIKTAAIEWPSVRCKVIDLDAIQSASALAGQLIAEMASSNGPVELSYQGVHRFIPQPRLAPPDLTGRSSMTIGPDSVILITGGARGITAKIAFDLARRYRPILWIVGRSPRPTGEEAEETRGIDAPRELKAALLNRLRRDAPSVTPARVEAAYRRLCQDREVRINLAEMERTGARVHYEPVDVRDERAFGDLIDRIYQSHGRIDGVVHGAGIIEDKLLLDKDPESFQRVFDTKTDSAFVLSRRLRPDSLKFLVFFASVAGRFGNKGQGDYAAANEVLNKLAIYLDRKWPARVVSINWGPWATGGMVSPALERELQERGMQLIPSEEGLRKFHDELLGGRKGEVEVVVGDGPWASSAGSDLIGMKTQEGG